MDLILLQPGDSSLLGTAPIAADSHLTTDQAWRTQLPELGPCIELISLHQGMKQQMTTDISNSARSSGRPVVTEFTCVKYVDQSSVKLYDHCLRAQPLGQGAEQPSRIYICRNTGDAIATIMSFALRDAIISEIQLQSHPDDMPTEQFKLNFTEILWAYHTQSAREPGTSQHAGWSLMRNRPITAFS
ncbi:type VI secretion system tube protein Hcp [Uliginosibacterium sediminicola]|uniref:Type VI secretion system tube protein Hcp n=1 Tax=Uliginosibacterium sediminicola TaxID=2024550 RepID=A0ABU9Z0Z4_9RHOO